MYLGCDRVKKYCVLDLPIHYSPVLERTLHVVVLCCTFGPRYCCVVMSSPVLSCPGLTNENENDVDINIHSIFCKHSLVINCGFARVAICDLSSISRGHHRDTIIDKAARL